VGRRLQQDLRAGLGSGRRRWYVRTSSVAPGEYGLNVGHDAYEDAEVYPGALIDHPEGFKEMANPWKRATVVTVNPGQIVLGVVLEFPDQ
jgi:hypothetical protein